MVVESKAVIKDATSHLAIDHNNIDVNTHTCFLEYTHTYLPQYKHTLVYT